jgi:hypothetical protein
MFRYLNTIRTFIFALFIGFTLSGRVSGQNVQMNLLYLSYFGSPGNKDGIAVSIDKTGSIFLSGNTSSRYFPTTPNAYDTTYHGGDSDGYGGDVYVSKLNNSGTSLLYSTHVGGSKIENHTYFNAVDDAGNIYITGHTQSNDFPVTSGAFDASYNQNGDVFIFKLDSTGSRLLWATYLGGSGDETSMGIAVDHDGNVYVAGRTNSPDFPVTPGAFDTTYNGGYISFITKINASGTGLVYSTFLGGSNFGGDYGTYAIGKIFVNKSGEVYYTANANRDYTISPNAYDNTFNGGNWDVYIAKLNVAGSAIVSGTYLGGASEDRPMDLLVDNEGYIYVAGNTISTNFPTTQDAYQKNYAGGSHVIYGGDSFIAKLSPSCDSLLYCTYIGGSNDENGANIFLSPSGNLYFTLSTSSSGLATSTSAYSNRLNGATDIYFGKFNASLQKTEYASYFGGNGNDSGTILFDSENNLIILGSTSSTNLPVTQNAYQKNNRGYDDLFYAKFKMEIETGVNVGENKLFHQNFQLNFYSYSRVAKKCKTILG